MLTETRTDIIDKVMIGSHTSRLVVTKRIALMDTEVVLLVPETADPDIKSLRRVDTTFFTISEYATAMLNSGKILVMVKAKKLYCQPWYLCDDKVNRRHEEGREELINPVTDNAERTIWKIHP